MLDLGIYVLGTRKGLTSFQLLHGMGGDKYANLGQFYHHDHDNQDFLSYS